MVQAKNICQKWDLNPRPHTRTRILILHSLSRGQGLNLESGALDHSAILTVRKSEGETQQKVFVSSHLGIEPRTFGLEVQRAILCANGTLMFVRYKKNEQL